jgi:spermidine/putrescine transport system ATP-binding protein
MSDALIYLEDVTRVFKDDIEEKVAVDSVNLRIRRREFVTLLGPSGCGKTTTLRMIAGFEAPTSGRIYIDGKDMDGVPAYKRKVNTVFQRYALFPHLNVEENIAFGLHVKKLPREQITPKVDGMLDMVGLKGYGKRKVDSLSGGEQQRVAIARALVNEPEVLLLDEPLGALDLKKRKEMQIELKNMQQELGITFVYVTHDQEEALTMSDTIVVMSGGKIQQIGTPQDVYNEPQNRFVADFIGESNIIDGIMAADKEVWIHGQAMECVDVGFEKDEPVDVVIRPEDIYIVTPENGKLAVGVVESVVFKGVHYEMIITDEYGYEWMVQDTNHFPVGERVGMIVKPFDIHIMRKPTDPTADIPSPDEEADEEI